MLAYVKRHVREARKVPLCGNSIATDRWFIARDMPELDNWLHYRMIDVSSVKELARRWYPRAYFASPDKHGGHRALADINESVRELRYYREACSCRSRARTRRPRGRSRRGTPAGVGRGRRGRGRAGAGTLYSSFGRAMSPRAARVLLPARPYGQATRWV